MGMVLDLYAVRPEVGRQILADPPLVCKVVNPDDDDWYQTLRKEYAGGGSLLTKLFGKKPAPVAFDYDPSEEDVMSLDKLWNVVHAALTGHPTEGDPPLNFLIYGGENAGDLDTGYGPARVMGPAEVATVSAALAAKPDAEILAYIPDEAAKREIYLGQVFDEEEKDEYVRDAVNELREFFKRSSGSGKSVVIHIN